MTESYNKTGGYGKRPLWQWILIYLVVGGIIYGLIYYFVFANRGGYSYKAMPQQQNTQQINSTTQPSGSSVQNVATKDNFVVDADDETASQTQLNVAKGHTIAITFNVKNGSTYHGGLDFRSDLLTTGTIPTGSSKTVTFTANKSFTLVPYWPSSNIKKPYTIQVNVQ